MTSLAITSGLSSTKVKRNLVVGMKAMQTKTATKLVVETLAVAQNTPMKGQMVVQMVVGPRCNVKTICLALVYLLDINSSSN